MFDIQLKTRDTKSKSSVFESVHLLVNYVNRDDWKVYGMCIKDQLVNSMKFKL